MEKVTFVQKVVIRHPQDKDKFLLLIRNINDKSRPGDFDIPGGSVEEGETHDDAIKREVKEETCLEIENIKPLLVNSRINPETGKYFLYIGYEATAKDINVILNPNEHDSYIWITLEEFKEKTNNNHILLSQIELIYQ